ncbi:MAG: DNA polymerase IV, partial [Calditrichaeota bacterium]
GMVLVKENEVQSFLAPLDISRMWGVGKKTLPILQAMGIHTFGDLAAFPQDELYRRFGESGRHFYQLAHGIDDRAVMGGMAAKSISKEITFEQDVYDLETLINTLRFLCNELAREMRRHQYRGKTVTLKIRLQDFSTYTRSRTVPDFIDHFNDLFQHIEVLFSQFERQTSAVRLLGVAVSNLQCGQGQMELFEEASPLAYKVDEVMDKIREKFGENSITRASLLHNRRDSQWIRD